MLFYMQFLQHCNGFILHRTFVVLLVYHEKDYSRSLIYVQNDDTIQLDPPFIMTIGTSVQFFSS